MTASCGGLRKLSVFEYMGKRIGTIEQEGERNECPCDGCSAPCCREIAPLLTFEEFTHSKFAFMLVKKPENIEVNVEALITVLNKEGKCIYLNEDPVRCKIWPNVPKACFEYKCEKGGL